MKTNVGTLDQALRISAGLALLLLFAVGWIGPWGLVGLVPLVTGLLRFCPLYRLLGIRTCAASRGLP
jgi:hypothetical protein